MYFNMVRTDFLEMDPLATSAPLPPTNIPPYVVYRADFNTTVKFHT